MTKNTKKSKIKDKSNTKNKPDTKKEQPSRPAKIKKYVYGDYISRFSFQFWTEFYKKSFKRRSLFFVIMHLRNGKYDMFTVATDNKNFNYKGGCYVIDSDMIREDIHTGLNTFYYHQDVSIPFKINFELEKLTNQLEITNNDVVKAINPNSLKSFIHSEVIEKVMKGQELTNEMQFIKMVTVINLCVALGTLAILGKSMGWF